MTYHTELFGAIKLRIVLQTVSAMNYDENTLHARRVVRAKFMVQNSNINNLTANIRVTTFYHVYV